MLDYEYKFVLSLVCVCFLGKFTASIPGLYACALDAYSSDTTTECKLDLVKNMAAGNVESLVCVAHAHGGPLVATSCSGYVALYAGEELYVKGIGGSAYAKGVPLNIFKCHLVYHDEALN